jgi:hypothetical protein
MPLATQTEITLEGFDGAVTSVGCSLWQDRTLWALWITDGDATWQWKTQQRKSCNTCNSDRTPRQGMDSQRMHLVLQAPTHMPTLTHCNACPLWLKVGQIRILYNWFEESNNNSSSPPNVFGWAYCGIKGAPQAPSTTKHENAWFCWYASPGQYCHFLHDRQLLCSFLNPTSLCLPLLATILNWSGQG